MAVDKNLFLHGLAVVAILKCEAPYLKEWLDYHLLAGVDHFYLYDNDSPDNQAEVAAPYVEAGLVDYFSLPGKKMQMVAYNDALNRFKFSCRYMTFLDGDEFIYPKLTGGTIIDVVDEILSRDPNAGGVEINWQFFGSNGQEKADYSRGVLERFTRRAANDLESKLMCKTIVNARKVNFFYTPHCATYFEGAYALKPNGEVQKTLEFISPPLTDKIVINHYHCKSWEEYQARNNRGDVFHDEKDRYNRSAFEGGDKNDEFDDGILKYRAARAENFSLESNEHRLDRVIESLIDTLSKFNSGETIVDMETALTCLALSTYLREHFANDADYWKICEQKSLKAILTLFSKLTFTEAQLLISELPNLLSLPYPAVEELRKACFHIIPQMMNVMRLNKNWFYYVELDYIQRLLKNFGK